MTHRLAIALSVFALSLPFADSTCTPPPDGLWIIETYEGEVQFREPVNGYIHLRRNPTVPNVYTGRSILFTDIFGPGRQGLVFLLHAVFDESQCKLYGGHYSDYFLARDNIQWVFDGKDEMIGYFVVKVATSFFFRYHSMQRLKFAGPIDDTPLDWLNGLGPSHGTHTQSTIPGNLNTGGT